MLAMTESWDLKKKKSSSPLLTNCPKRAFRPLVLTPPTDFSAQLHTTISTAFLPCITTRDWHHLRPLPSTQESTTPPVYLLYVHRPTTEQLSTLPGKTKPKKTRCDKLSILPSMSSATAKTTMSHCRIPCQSFSTRSEKTVTKHASMCLSPTRKQRSKVKFLTNYAIMSDFLCTFATHNAKLRKLRQ